MSNSNKFTRRKFIKATGCAYMTGFGMATTAIDMSIMTRLAAAQAADDFKCWVMVFMKGGMDAANVVVRMDNQGYNAYSNERSRIAIARNNLVALNAADEDGMPVGMHPGFSDLADLINGGNAAAILNVGPTQNPLTNKDGAERASGIKDLYSHDDQQFQWQTSSIANRDQGGVLGRALDVVRSFNTGANFATAISTAGETIALVGDTVQPFVMKDGDVPNVEGGEVTSNAESPTMQAASTLTALQSGIILDTAYASLFEDSFSANEVIATINNEEIDNLIDGNNDWDRQFKRALKLIAAARTGGLGTLNRMAIFVSDGGWDTHKGQNLNGLGGQLSGAISRFYGALGAINSQQNVTITTASDFGRTGNDNGDSGTDHGWGSHHFAIGGAVQAGVYGRAPLMQRNGPEVLGNRVRMMPRFSCDQYFASLANWWGVPAGEMNSVYQHLSNFNNPSIGFMG